MRRIILASHRRLLTVLALTAVSLLPALSASARPVPGGGAPTTTSTEPVSTAQAASAGMGFPTVFGLLAVVLCVGVVAYIAGVARERRAAPQGA